MSCCTYYRISTDDIDQDSPLVDQDQVHCGCVWRGRAIHRKPAVDRCGCAIAAVFEVDTVALIAFAKNVPENLPKALAIVGYAAGAVFFCVGICALAWSTLTISKVDTEPYLMPLAEVDPIER